MSIYSEERVPLKDGYIVSGIDYKTKNEKSYKIESFFAYGGSGIVYKAVEIDDGSNKRVCIKEFYPSKGYFRDKSGIIKANTPSGYSIDTRAIEEYKCGQKIKYNNSQVGIIEELLVVEPSGNKDISGKGTTNSNEKNYYAVMQDFSDACDINSLLQKVKKNYEHEKNSNRENLVYTPLLNAEGNNFSAFAVFSIIRRILHALRRIHLESGYIHADISPRNILFSNPDLYSMRNYELGSVIFIDFGSAREIDMESGYTEIITDSIFTTLKPLAPEQKEGMRMSRATDLYQVGLLFLMLLTGQYDEDRIQGFYASDSLKRYGIYEKDCKRVLGIINKALSPKQEDRYKHAEELLKEITDLENKYYPRNHMLSHNCGLDFKPIARDEEIREVLNEISLMTTPLWIWSSVRGMGKTTFAHMLVDEINRNTEHNAYLIQFNESVFWSIANIELIGDDKEEDISDRYNKRIALLQELDTNDVIIVDNFFSDDKNFSDFLTDEYYDSIHCKAKKIFTTNYRLGIEYNTFELKEILHDDLIDYLITHRIINRSQDSYKKAERLIELIYGNTYVFCLICNLIMDSEQTIDSIIDLFEKDRISDSIVVPISNKDGKSFNDEAMIELLQKLYNVVGLNDQDKDIMLKACLLSGNSIEEEIFCSSIYFSRLRVTDYEDINIECIEVDKEIKKTVSELIKKGWLIGEKRGTKRFVRIHDLVVKILKSSGDYSKEACIDFLKGYTFALSIGGTENQESRSFFYSVAREVGAYKDKNLGQKSIIFEIKTYDISELDNNTDKVEEPELNRFISALYALSKRDYKGTLDCFRTYWTTYNYYYADIAVSTLLWISKVFNVAVESIIHGFLARICSNTSTNDNVYYQRLDEMYHKDELELFNFDFSLDFEDELPQCEMNIADYNTNSSISIGSLEHILYLLWDENNSFHHIISKKQYSTYVTTEYEDIQYEVVFDHLNTIKRFSVKELFEYAICIEKAHYEKNYDILERGLKEYAYKYNYVVSKISEDIYKSIVQIIVLHMVSISSMVFKYDDNVKVAIKEAQCICDLYMEIQLDDCEEDNIDFWSIYWAKGFFNLRLSCGFYYQNYYNEALEHIKKVSIDCFSENITKLKKFSEFLRQIYKQFYLLLTEHLNLLENNCGGERKAIKIIYNCLFALLNYPEYTKEVLFHKLLNECHLLYNCCGKKRNNEIEVITDIDSFIICIVKCYVEYINTNDHYSEEIKKSLFEWMVKDIRERNDNGQLYNILISQIPDYYEYAEKYSSKYKWYMLKERAQYFKSIGNNKDAINFYIHSIDYYQKTNLFFDNNLRLLYLQLLSVYEELNDIVQYKNTIDQVLEELSSWMSFRGIHVNKIKKMKELLQFVDSFDILKYARNYIEVIYSYEGILNIFYMDSFFYRMGERLVAQHRYDVADLYFENLDILNEGNRVALITALSINRMYGASFFYDTPIFIRIGDLYYKDGAMNWAGKYYSKMHLHSMKYGFNRRNKQKLFEMYKNYIDILEKKDHTELEVLMYDLSSIFPDLQMRRSALFGEIIGDILCNNELQHKWSLESAFLVDLLNKETQVNNTKEGCSEHLKFCCYLLANALEENDSHTIPNEVIKKIKGYPDPLLGFVQLLYYLIIRVTIDRRYPMREDGVRGLNLSTQYIEDDIQSIISCAVTNAKDIAKSLYPDIVQNYTYERITKLLDPKGQGDYEGFEIENNWLSMMEMAIGCVISTNSFEACMELVREKSKKSYKVCMLTGGIAGLIYGYNTIPEKWKSIRDKGIVEKSCLLEE